MLNLFILLLAAVTLALLAVFFVLFIVFSGKREKQIAAAAEKIAELQKEIAENRVEAKCEFEMHTVETGRINAATAALIQQKHTETKAMIEKFLSEMKDDSITLKKDIQEELAKILKEITNPLLD